MTRRNTDDLIRTLAAKADPVRLLPGPIIRAAEWLTCSLLSVGFVTVVLTPRPDLAAKLTETRFVIEVATALATSIVAAIAAFATVVPGSGRTTLALVVLPLALWVGSLGVGCIQDWIVLGSAGRLWQIDWSCFPSILVAGAAPTIAMAVMLRRGAPLTPALSMALGGLAAGALADFGLRFHHREAGVMTLVWHLGAVCILLAAASRTGHYVLKWRPV